jgi:hypothetical protein
MVSKGSEGALATAFSYLVITQEVPSRRLGRSKADCSQEQRNSIPNTKRSVVVLIILKNRTKKIPKPLTSLIRGFFGVY